MKIMPISIIIFHEVPWGYLRNLKEPQEPLRGDSLLFTNKSSALTDTHLIYLRGMKDQYILSYFYKALGLFLSPENLPNFLLKPYMLSWLRKNLKFMMFR